MSLSTNASKRMLIALTSQSAGNEVVSAINNGAAVAALGGFYIPASIVATAASAVTDFGALKVGDQVIHIPAVAGNADWAAVITAGTNPDGAAVIGDLYIVLRAMPALPAAASFVL